VDPERFMEAFPIVTAHVDEIEGGGPVADLAGYEPVLRDHARRMIGPRLRPILAPSDLMQETLLIAARRLAEVSGRPSRLVLAWLLRTMRFRLMRFVRDHRTEMATPADPTTRVVEPPGASTPVLSRLVREEMRATLLATIERLEEQDRQVLRWIYLEKRTTAEIAARLGRTESAIRGLHHRAVGHLRRLIEIHLP
jgi:RNA polymerase sigma-70 factor (ECF subfamily)